MFQPRRRSLSFALAHMTHEPPLASTVQPEIKVVFHFEGVVLAGDTSEMRHVIGERESGKSRRAIFQLPWQLRRGIVPGEQPLIPLPYQDQFISRFVCNNILLTTFLRLHSTPINLNSTINRPQKFFNPLATFLHRIHALLKSERHDSFAQLKFANEHA